MRRFGTALSSTILLHAITLSASASAAPQKTPATATDKANPAQVSGTVVDSSGAVMAGATVQIRSVDGAEKMKTRTDANGAFNISGLAAGNYRLVVASTGFETKEIPVTVGTGEASAPLRISLAVSHVNTAVTVNGRNDDLVGIADSATQGTVGAEEIQDRPILRSGAIIFG